MVRRGPKSWATVEEEAFLKALLPEYRKCWHQKAYGNFWIDTLHAIFSQWPEHMHLHRNPNLGIPAEGDLTPHQREIVGQAIVMHKQVIKHWFRWRMNMARLARSGNSRGVLNIDDTLGGGERATADAAIIMEGISSREDDAICTEVKEKHTEMLTKWKHDCELAKVGSVEEIDDDAKMQAFNELGSHLDQVFCHLSYKTGGLKFTCIAGGRDPSTGEVVVVDFHLGETDTGVELSAFYPRFLDVQVAYADFAKDAVAHNDKMQSLMSEEASAMALAVSKDGDDLEWTCGDNNGNMHDDEDVLGHTTDLYHIPQAEVSMSS
ncbi:hypothetical protein F4604DRAFT_1919987 [Suillus subluteus]|nr:hypothetical protein F4604DRAFT_1919987 [Suillus subluteus]